MNRLLFLLTLSSSLLAQTGNLRVIVLAVDEFDAPQDKTLNLNLDGFKASVESAVTQISEYFQSSFKTDVKVITGKSQTTRAAIQKYLNTEYVSAELPSVTIVFVLSHGFGHVFPTANELFIATSETDRGSFLGSAYDGTELIRKLARVPPRSSVFLFLDTCQSAAIDFGSITKLLKEDLAGSRFMVMAAADAGAKAYNFNFSKALIDLWKAATVDECERERDEIDEKVCSSFGSVLTARPNNARKSFSHLTVPFASSPLDGNGRSQSSIIPAKLLCESAIRKGSRFGLQPLEP